MNLYIASARELKEVSDEVKISTLTDLSLTATFTDKKNCARLICDYNEENAKQLIDYIREHLKMCPRIELWNVGNGNVENISVTKCSKYLLTSEKLKDILEKDPFESSKCLVVYNS